MLEHTIVSCQCEGKRCSKCGEVRCVGMFWRDTRVKSGLQARCKVCLDAKNKAYYRSNTEQMKEQARQYYTERAEHVKESRKVYYRKNREHVKEQMKVYYQKHADYIKMRERMRRLLHIEQIRANDRARSQTLKRREQRLAGYRSHLEKYITSRRIRYYRNVEQERRSSRVYYQTHREQAKIYQQRYHEVHPGLRAVYARNRRARERQATGTFTSKQWAELKISFDYTCLCCGRKEPNIQLTIDHVVPVAKGGANTIDNLQPLCLSCNTSKKDKTIDYRKGRAL